MSNLGSLFTQNLGGYLFGVIVVLLAYTAIGIYDPNYANAFAVVTLLGVIIFWVKKNG